MFCNYENNFCNYVFGRNLKMRYFNVDSRGFYSIKMPEICGLFCLIIAWEKTQAVEAQSRFNNRSEH
ncbi:hypothetical protein VNO78_08186 [Psophocarpus tetragonolobus]|uniref:Uncharacterized protein n=1 Tax=Psophocarpus tetragonolobus TaxID=3891 RepID=A0AAN9SXH7_PSOTE